VANTIDTFSTHISWLLGCNNGWPSDLELNVVLTTYSLMAYTLREKNCE